MDINDDEKEVLHFYKLLSRRVKDGSRSVVFNQAAEMMFQLDIMINDGYPTESVVEFVRSYRELLYDYP